MEEMMVGGVNNTAEEIGKVVMDEMKTIEPANVPNPAPRIPNVGPSKFDKIVSKTGSALITSGSGVLIGCLIGYGVTKIMDIYKTRKLRKEAEEIISDYENDVVDSDEEDVDKTAENEK